MVNAPVITDEVSASGIVADWPEPAGSYYNRPWRGYVEVFGFQYGVPDAKWLRIARISSVDQGQAFVTEHVYDAQYRIVDVGGNVYESGVAQGSPASA